MTAKLALNILKKTVLIIVIVILGVSALAQSLLNLQFRISDRKILERLKHQSVKPVIDYVGCKDYLVRCISLIRNDTLPAVIFVHGAPGSSADFISFMGDSILSQNFNLFDYDRPGYGHSGFGKSLTSFEEQAVVLKKIINKYKLKKVFLVGHSFGGPVCLKLEIDYPDLTDGMLLLAPAVDPSNEKILKIAYLAKWPVFRWITPTALKVAADEKFSHIEELEKMVPFLDEIDEKVIYVHGTKDSLVPFENLAFLEKKLENARFEKIILQDEDHFLPWTQHELIRNKILELASGGSR